MATLRLRRHLVAPSDVPDDRLLFRVVVLLAGSAPASDRGLSEPLLGADFLSDNLARLDVDYGDLTDRASGSAILLDALRPFGLLQFS